MRQQGPSGHHVPGCDPLLPRHDLLSRPVPRFSVLEGNLKLANAEDSRLTMINAAGNTCASNALRPEKLWHPGRGGRLGSPPIPIPYRLSHPAPCPSLRLLISSPHPLVPIRVAVLLQGTCCKFRVRVSPSLHAIHQSAFKD